MIKDVITPADLVLGAHYHPGFKEQEKDGVWFYNSGSILRIENTVENRKNKPKVVIFDIDATTGTFKSEYKELQSAQDGNKVFSAKVNNSAYQASLGSFHSKLKGKKFKGVDILSLVDDYAKEHNEDDEIVKAVKDKMNKFAIANAVDTGFRPELQNICITKVEIFNFQAHGHKVVDFTKGLNVITGESNSGKTAILRAIYWALYDKPNGSDFIKTGAKSCKVRLFLSNGFIIERKRNKSSSGTFVLIQPDGSLEEYKGFSSKIPIEITNAHQMPEVKINGSTYRINIASQLDSPFLIGNSSSERISMIGSLVNADRADEASKEFKLDKTRANTEKTKFLELQTEKEKSLEKYVYLDKLKQTIDVIEMAIQKLDADESNIAKYEDAYNSYVQSKTNLAMTKQRLNQIIIPGKDLVDDYKVKVGMVEQLNGLHEDYLNLLQTYKNTVRTLATIPNLEDLKSRTTIYNDYIDKLIVMESLDKENKRLSNLSFEFNYDLHGLKELTLAYKQCVEVVEKGSELSNQRNIVLVSAEETKSKLASVIAQLDDLAKQKADKLEELKGQDFVCPTCHQKIDAETALAGGC